MKRVLVILPHAFEVFEAAALIEALRERYATEESQNDLIPKH